MARSVCRHLALSTSPSPTRSAAAGAVAAAAVISAALAPAASAQDASPAPILQWFESTYATQEDRMADVFMAGYGAIWFPPPGRADSGNQSVGYDVYDRFDLGTPGDPTLYGTETGLRTTIDTLHRAGLAAHSDLILNHNGFSDASTPDFIEAGDYPGFVVQNPDGDGDPFGVPNTDGDFNSSFDSGDLRGRLAGLIDIDHATNHVFIRHPVEPGDPLNLPAGDTPRFGRLADVPDPNNRRFYPDRDLDPILVFDPATGESDLAIYPFNPDDPTAGDPVAENATGLLMRHAQWMVQDVGFDGFRLDAAKHFDGFVLDFFDRAVYRSNPRKNLDGSTQHVFSYSEVFDGDVGFLQSFVRKDIDDADPGRVGGNRDSLDFAQYFALRGNLSGGGVGNDWRDVAYAGMDANDDGLINGSSGVTFVVNHDDGPPDMNNVAHAYLLMRPGNSVVYYNAKEHGDGRDFPKDGRGDALGNFGDTVTELVNLRNTHGRGDYRERWIDENVLIYERSGSAMVVLNNRNDGGYDQRRVDVDLPWGTPLVELTGNAASHADIPELAVVDNDVFGGPSRVTLRSLRNDGQDKGYLIYGLAAPRSDAGLHLSNVDSILPPTDLGDSPTNQDQARARLTPLSVISADSFTVTLETDPVTLEGTVLDGSGSVVPASIRDRDADGDAALIKVNGGLDVNGNGVVDNVTPGSASYGFEGFTVSRDGFSDPDGEGFYQQAIDATELPEGMNFITARAFRHRNPATGGDGGPAVFRDFKKVIYVDRLPPESTVQSFDPVTEGVNENRTLTARSLDQTADNIHVLHNLGAALTDAEVLGMLDGETQGSRLDRDLWTRDLTGLVHGNHAITLVSFEPTGSFNVQRFGGLFVSTIFGAGLGDLDHDGGYSVFDIELFEDVLLSENRVFNPAADFDGDGWIDLVDLDLLGERLLDVNADAATLDAYRALVSEVPEPATGVLLGLLMIGAAGGAGRRRQGLPG